MTSDTEDDAEEWLQDWLQVKAEESGIRILNDFGRHCLLFLNKLILATPSKNKPERRSLRPLNKNDETSTLFDYVYRTFELTSFDQLLRDQERLQKKVLQLDSLNEAAGQSNTFMKFFKAVSICQLYFDEIGTKFRVLIRSASLNLNYFTGH